MDISTCVYIHRSLTMKICKILIVLAIRTCAYMQDNRVILLSLQSFVSVFAYFGFWQGDTTKVTEPFFLKKSLLIEMKNQHLEIYKLYHTLFSRLGHVNLSICYIQANISQKHISIKMIMVFSNTRTLIIRLLQFYKCCIWKW